MSVSAAREAELLKYQIELSAINSEIKKGLEKLNSKDDNKELRNELAACYFKRSCIKLESLKNYVGSVYDLTISLQYNASPMAFFKRGELFYNLEFYELALDDFKSTYEHSKCENDRGRLLLKILKLRESIEKSQN